MRLDQSWKSFALFSTILFFFFRTALYYYQENNKFKIALAMLASANHLIWLVYETIASHIKLIRDTVTLFVIAEDH